MNAIACGSFHTIARTESCKLFSWGVGKYGRLGLGDERDQPTPKEIHHGALKQEAEEYQIACGWAFSIAISKRGVFTRGEEERKVNWDFRTQVIKASHVLSMDLEAIAHG